MIIKSVLILNLTGQTGFGNRLAFERDGYLNLLELSSNESSFKYWLMSQIADAYYRKHHKNK
jgi:hypothetical protein